MSASLVGSEMCIRDSYLWGVRADRNQIYPGCARTSAGRAGWRAGARSEGCLLYTSDAADDM
eukprot:4155166-Alexandrium_andersonii.AAC.1